MKNLNYLRLVLDKDGNEVDRTSHRTRVHKEPAMPADIECERDADVRRERDDEWEFRRRGF